MLDESRARVKVPNYLHYDLVIRHEEANVVYLSEDSLWRQKKKDLKKLYELPNPRNKVQAEQFADALTKANRALSLSLPQRLLRFNREFEALQIRIH